MRPSSELGAIATGSLVVWDVDGTLTRSDTLLPILRLLVGSSRWLKVMAQAAQETATHGASRNYLKASLLQHCLAGLEQEKVLAVARSFAHDIETHRCRGDAMRRWSWHRARGDHQILASASPAVYLRPLGDSLGADVVLATELQVQDGRFTGDMAGINCRGREKARKVRDVIAATHPDEVWVYSDSSSDTPSFDLADIAVRVRPWSFIPPLSSAVGHTHSSPETDSQ